MRVGGGQTDHVEGSAGDSRSPAGQTSLTRLLLGLGLGLGLGMGLPAGARGQGVGVGVGVGVGTIKGVVRASKTGEAVAGATVLIVGTRLGAIVDTGGRYTIADVPAGRVTVRARFLGFVDGNQTLHLAE